MVWFYFRNMLGFAIQLGFTMALCFIPFDKNCFKYGAKRTMVFFGIFALVMSLIFPLPLMLSDFVPVLLGNTYMLATILAFAVLYFLAIGEHPYKKFLVINLATVYAAVQYMIVNFISSTFAVETVGGVYGNIQLLSFALSAAVLFPVMAVIFRRTVRNYIRHGESRFIRREFWLVFAFSMVYFSLLIVYSSMFDINDALRSVWALLMFPYIFAAAVLVMFYWQLLRDSVKRKEEYERQRNAEIQQLQYDRIMRDSENSRRTRHDLRHHLNALYAMAEQGREDELKEYISEIIDRTATTESTWFCENITINSLLQDYVGRAREQGVACKVAAVCGEVPVSPVHLTVILGNALENALRSAASAEEGWMRVDIGVLGGTLAIQIENSCSGVHFADEVHGAQFLPARSFLSDRLGGGLGLHSIELAAEKYGGEALFCYDAEKASFTSRIILNLFPH